LLKERKRKVLNWSQIYKMIMDTIFRLVTATCQQCGAKNKMGGVSSTGSTDKNNIDATVIGALSVQGCPKCKSHDLKYEVEYKTITV
jgi:hypothetical protein